MLIDAWFHCVHELLSPCRTAMLPLTFGAPALEELPVLELGADGSIRGEGRQQS